MLQAPSSGDGIPSAQPMPSRCHRPADDIELRQSLGVGLEGRRGEAPGQGAIIQQLAEEHAREAALLWSLFDDEPDDDLRERIRRHVAGMRACVRRGADPLAGLGRPLTGADLLPAACLGPVEAEDETGLRAIAAAADYA